MAGNPRLLVMFTAAVALVVGVVAGLMTDNWIYLPIVLAVHGVGTFLVLQAVGRRVADEPEPDPIVKERLEEEQKTI